jgi:hypothetical protein
VRLALRLLRAGVDADRLRSAGTARTAARTLRELLVEHAGDSDDSDGSMLAESLCSGSEEAVQSETSAAKRVCLTPS